MTVFDSQCRTAGRVVHLCNALLAQARKAPRETEDAPLGGHHATAGSGLVGPLQVRIPLILSTNDGHEQVDAVGGAIEPGTHFYLRHAPGTSGITPTAKNVADLHGRVLTVLALDEASQRITPEALAIATEMNIEFDISWQAEAWSYVVGDNR